ncbi:MAG: type II toxin-antitoxin system RelE family toxin [Schwartzia sp. (in: firmicutes)]
MSEYSIFFSKRAKKELLKIDKPIRRTIVSWIEKNIKGTRNPRLHGKALMGDLKGYWRYRVGNYRIIAEIRDEEWIVIAVSIAHRSSVYEEL